MLKLYDTQRSGNAWKVRLLAGFLGLPLERTTLSIDRGDLRSPQFLRIAQFAQVPVLQLEDGEHLCESIAILYHLAQGTAWWPQEAGAQARVLSWLSFEQDRHMRPLAKLRLRFGLKTLPSATQEQVERWTGEAQEALALLERQLAARPGQWVATAQHPSIADVALYPYTRMAPLGRIGLEPFPATLQWLERFEALAGYQPLFPGVPGSHLHTSETTLSTESTESHEEPR